MKKTFLFAAMCCFVINLWAGNVITYTASEKLPETTSSSSSGLHTNAFNVAISSHTFASGKGTITFDGDVTTIGSHAFSGSDFTEVTIPNSVTHIKQLAFYDCNMTEIMLPSSLQYIGGQAFDQSYLSEIICYASTPPTVVTGNYGTFWGVRKDISIFVLTSSISAYKNAEGWKEFYNYKPLIMGYDLFIKGNQVNSDNCHDILGNGTVSYDDATKTLTLNNATISYNDDAVKSTQDLIIECIGENTIASTGSNDATVFTSGNLTITGTGSLLVQSTQAFGIYALSGLTIEGGCTVSTKSTKSIGVVTNALTVNNANLLVSGNGTTPTISCGALTMKKAGILTGQTYDESSNKFLTAKGEEAQGQIVIGQIYDLFICGNQVNYFNCNAVLGDSKVSYNDATKTLTLNNATISCDGKTAINIAESQPFTIECIGTNTITTTGNGFAVANTTVGSTTFTGSGSVNMSSYYPTYFGVVGPLKIQDGCSVTLQSSAGSCIGAGQLTVDNAKLVAKGNGTVVTIVCSGLTMENGVQIRSNHTFDAEQKKFLNAAGEEAKDDIIIGVEGTGLEGLTIDNAQCTIRKMIIDNQLFILRGDKIYNAAGVEL